MYYMYGMNVQPENRIKELRKSKGFTQETLAAKIGGVSAGQIRKLEAGLGGLTIYWLRKVSAALDVYPSDLLIETDRNPHTRAIGQMNAELLADILQVALEYNQNINKSNVGRLTPSAMAAAAATLYNELSTDAPPKNVIRQQASILFKFAATQ